MAAGEWFYATRDQQMGPVSLDALRQMVASGQVASSDLVWTDSMASWVPASTVPVLAPSQVAPQYPVPQPQVAPIPNYYQPTTPAYNNPVNPQNTAPVANYYTPWQGQQPRWAGFWIRFVAYVIDTIIVLIPIGIINVSIMGMAGAYSNTDDSDGMPPKLIVAMLASNLIGQVIGWLYWAIMESSSAQGTLGKMMLGIKVTDLNGNRISFARASGRYFAKFVSSIILLIGFVMAAFTQKKQALHDMMASTLVIGK